jgi:hypothetical protein
MPSASSTAPTSALVSSSMNGNSPCGASDSPTSGLRDPTPGRRWKPRPNRSGDWSKAPGTSADPQARRCASSTTGPARYQASACFYCGARDRRWKLVRACAVCNRGPAGKFHRLAYGDFLGSLWQRNERLISSHHPLRESIIAATGRTPSARLDFLRSVPTRATKSFSSA